MITTGNHIIGALMVRQNIIAWMFVLIGAAAWVVWRIR